MVVVILLSYPYHDSPPKKKKKIKCITFTARFRLLTDRNPIWIFLNKIFNFVTNTNWIQQQQLKITKKKKKFLNVDDLARFHMTVAGIYRVFFFFLNFPAKIQIRHLSLFLSFVFKLKHFHMKIEKKRQKYGNLENDITRRCISFDSSLG